MDKNVHDKKCPKKLWSQVMEYHFFTLETIRDHKPFFQVFFHRLERFYSKGQYINVQIPNLQKSFETVFSIFVSLSIKTIIYICNN
jgi:hypothetical protein